MTITKGNVSTQTPVRAGQCNSIQPVSGRTGHTLGGLVFGPMVPICPVKPELEGLREPARVVWVLDPVHCGRHGKRLVLCVLLQKLLEYCVLVCLQYKLQSGM